MALGLAASSSVALSHSLSLHLVGPSAPPPPTPPSLLPLLSHPHRDTSNPTHLRFPRQLKPATSAMPESSCSPTPFLNLLMRKLKNFGGISRISCRRRMFLEILLMMFFLSVPRSSVPLSTLGFKYSIEAWPALLIMSTFPHTEYGDPGTLLVISFIDMADTINERGLPGGLQAARAAVLWAQKQVDKDWDIWKGTQKSAADE